MLILIVESSVEGKNQRRKPRLECIQQSEINCKRSKMHLAYINKKKNSRK